MSLKIQMPSYWLPSSPLRQWRGTWLGKLDFPIIGGGQLWVDRRNAIWLTSCSSRVWEFPDSDLNANESKDLHIHLPWSLHQKKWIVYSHAKDQPLYDPLRIGPNCKWETWMNVQFAFPLHLFDNRIDFLFYQTIELHVDGQAQHLIVHDLWVWEFPNAKNRIKTIRRNRVCRSKYWIILSICNFCKLRLIRRPGRCCCWPIQRRQCNQMPSIISTADSIQDVNRVGENWLF